jgi:hypothetical protein
MLAFFNVDIRPDILPFSYHPGLTSSESGSDEAGELVGVRVLDTEIS